jgi:hypothetical protein
MPLLYVWPLPKKRPDVTNTVQLIEVYKNFIVSKPLQPLSELAYSLLHASHFKFTDTFRSGSSVPLAGRNCLVLIAGVFGDYLLMYLVLSPLLNSFYYLWDYVILYF